MTTATTVTAVQLILWKLESYIIMHFYFSSNSGLADNFIT